MRSCLTGISLVFPREVMMDAHRPATLRGLWEGAMAIVTASRTSEECSAGCSRGKMAEAREAEARERKSLWETVGLGLRHLGEKHMQLQAGWKDDTLERTGAGVLVRRGRT